MGNDGAQLCILIFPEQNIKNKKHERHGVCRFIRCWTRLMTTIGLHLCRLLRFWGSRASGFSAIGFGVGLSSVGFRVLGLGARFQDFR